MITFERTSVMNMENAPVYSRKILTLRLGSLP